MSRTKCHHASIRRNRFANGSNSFRSRSLDDDNETNRRRRSLSKSKTLNSISTSKISKIIRNYENGNENGDYQNGGSTRRDNKRRRLFETNADQSPLWTTLTHARTLSDFTTES